MPAFERESIGAWLRTLLRLPRQGRFFFIVNNRNHVRIFAPIVRRLIELSLPCIIADIERESGDRGARRELASMGLSSVSLDELRNRDRPPRRPRRRQRFLSGRGGGHDAAVRAPGYASHRRRRRLPVYTTPPVPPGGPLVGLECGVSRSVRDPSSRRRLADNRRGMAAPCVIRNTRIRCDQL